MELTIKQIENGYIVKYSVEEEENKFKEYEEVFENTESERECLTRLLYYIGSYFGESYDKYGEENLNIKWDKKGRKAD